MHSYNLWLINILSALRAFVVKLFFILKKTKGNSLCTQHPY